MRTNIAHIFAIGYVVGQPMLARKAVHEAKVAAEVAEQRFRRQGNSVGRLYRTRSGVGGDDRNRGQSERHQIR